MKTNIKKLVSLVLSSLIIMSCVPFTVANASSAIEIFNDNSQQVNEKIYLTEYKSQQLRALVPLLGEDGSISGVEPDTSDGSYIEWSSNLPLLAGVDENGKVTAYDFSKTAVIQLWIDENIRTMPLVGDATADAIWKAFESSGIDLDSASTDMIVGIVAGIAGEALGNSLKTYLDNMNVVITATLYDASGKALCSDSVEFVIEKSIVASVAPTGVHITNKKTVPKVVAVGSTVQLYGAVTPVRLKQGVKWGLGTSALDNSSNGLAEVSGDGLVTFLSVGTVTVRVNPESTLYATFSDTVTFNVVDKSELPVTDFAISGETSVAEGSTIELSVTDVVPAGAYKGDLQWSSSDTSIAVVDGNGIVTGLDGGSGLTEYSKSVTITATMGGVSKNVTVSVTRNLTGNNISTVEISGDEILGIGAGAQYTATVFPSRLNNSSSVSRQWGVVDSVTGEYIPATGAAPAKDNIISVTSDGYVTALGAGVGTVYCTASYGSSSATAIYRITCGNAITDFEITGNVTLNEGDTSQLSINVLAPADYEKTLLDTVKWSVADDSIAYVSSDGLVLGRDAGGRNSSKKTTVYATVSGVTKEINVTVKRGWLNLSKYTDAQIEGPDYIIKDLPHKFSIKTYPTSLAQSATHWGAVKNDGSAPWNASDVLNALSGFASKVNSENNYISVSSDGTVIGKEVGSTTVYGISRYLYQSYMERSKDIDVIEIEPESITLKAPDKSEYVEGVTEIDLTGMEVYLTYNKESLEPYYSDWANYSDAMLKCRVTDYQVSEVRYDLLDMTQYIIVSVERAGKTYNAVFTVKINSKQVDSIDIKAPDKKVYLEGEELDLTGFEVTANYLNAESQVVTDYKIDYDSFSDKILDVEQQVRVYYEHEGRSAEGYFTVIFYGKPVVTVECNGVLGEWTSEPIVFTLSATHALDGVTFYRRTGENGSWVTMYSNELSLEANIDDVIYFKAVNSKGYESDVTEGYAIKHDNIVPSFSLKATVNSITAEDYTVNFNNLTCGISGIASITVNGAEIGSDAKQFTVTENKTYNVVVTSGSGLKCEQSINIENIDKEAPGITEIKLIKESEDVPERHPEGAFGNYYGGNIFAYAAAEDSGVAGVDYIKYRLVDSEYEPVTDWNVVSEAHTAFCDMQFKGYFEFVAVDKAGNVSSSVYSDGFVRDSVKPVIKSLNAVYGEKEYTSEVWADDVVIMSPEGDAFSGIYEVLYKIDDGQWQTLKGSTLEEKRNGTFRYYFKALSYSGLESEVCELTVNVDRTVPTIRVEFEGTFGQWTSENVTFRLSTLVNCPSGCRYYYSNGNGWQEMDGNVLVLDESTNAYYSFKVVNGAGLESAVSDSYKVMIDNQVPTGYIIPGVTVNTDTPYEVAIVPVAGESGYLKVYFNGDDVTETLKATVSENGKYALTIIGSNLLSSTVMVEITNFSNIPTALFTYEANDDETLSILAYNGSATNVTVPLEIAGLETVTLQNEAFKGKNEVVSVTLPNTLISIGGNCFSGCGSLEKITIPSSVEEISETAFAECENLTIYCYKDSYAESYAVAKGIPYVILDIVPVGKTLINQVAGIIFTRQKGRTVITDIVDAEAYTVFAIPSFVSGSVNYYGTGSTFYFFKDGMLAYTYKVAVYGDINGDSVSDVLDCAIGERALNDTQLLTDCSLLAVDFNTDGNVEASDYQQLVNISLE